MNTCPSILDCKHHRYSLVFLLNGFVYSILVTLVVISTSPWRNINFLITDTDQVTNELVMCFISEPHIFNNYKFWEVSYPGNPESTFAIPSVIIYLISFLFRDIYNIATLRVDCGYANRGAKVDQGCTSRIIQLSLPTNFPPTISRASVMIYASLLPVYPNLPVMHWIWSIDYTLIIYWPYPIHHLDIKKLPRSWSLGGVSVCVLVSRTHFSKLHELERVCDRRWFEREFSGIVFIQGKKQDKFIFSTWRLPFKQSKLLL